MKNFVKVKCYKTLYQSLSISVFFIVYSSSPLAEDKVVSSTKNYSFDDSLLKGSTFNLGNLNNFNQGTKIEPGSYKVDLYINNVFIKTTEVTFIKDTATNKIEPCFSLDELLALGIKKSSIDTPSNTNKQNCLVLDYAVKGASSNFIYSEFKLQLHIPQILLNTLPRGYVSPEALNEGIPVVFVNYNASQYHVSYKGDSNLKNVDSTYINMNIGANLGLWRYRQQTFFTKQSHMGSDIKTTNRYVQRAILPLQSELLIGESFTTGQYFSGIGYRGISLKSDDRMLPDSQRGYAPTIRGIAKTNANVVIRQGRNIIYQMTVPPGPFEINDLYATNYAGDLDVTVNEADGTVNSFTVPYSAVPDSLRPGVSRYDVTIGETRFVGDKDKFIDATYRRGISNSITLNTGFRTADGYQAILLGGVYSNDLGAFGATTTFSRAKILGKTETGWMSRLSYSRTFDPTNTTLTIANYRYSTSGYRDLNDTLGLRKAYKTNTEWDSSTYMQRSRFDVSINQSLGNYGNLFINGAIQDYYGNRKRDKQLQASYSKSFSNGLAVNFSVTRSQYGSYNTGVSYLDNYNIYQQYNIPKKSQTTTMVTLSMPLGYGNNAPSLSTSITKDSESGADFQTSLNGTLGEKQNSSYGVSYSTNDRDHIDTWNASFQTRLPVATASVSAANSDNYWQVSQGLQGSVVLHEGGITLGPYLGETFGIVEAKGAEGAEVIGGQGAKINRFGYAVIPYLAPYRYNNVLLSPEGMNSYAELVSNQKQVAPYAGAAVKIKFNTTLGYPVLFTFEQTDKDIPMGATVYDVNGKNVGMVGQGKQAYTRLEELNSKLTVRWGDKKSQQCQVDYNLNGQDINQYLIILNVPCI